MNLTDVLLRSVIIGLFWATTYIFIRRALNPEIGWVGRPENRTQAWDALFGGIAVATNTALLIYFIRGGVKN